MNLLQNNEITMEEKGSVWDVVIIGAGLAGLTASIYLASAGKKVLLLEKSSKAGGRAATTAVGGAYLNLGAHALYKSALKILNEVGVEPSGESPMLNISFVFGTDSVNETVKNQNSLFLGSYLKWSEKVQLIRFLTQIRKIDIANLQDVSLQQYLDKTIQSLRVRHLVQSLVRVSTYCHAPDLISAGTVILQLRENRVLYLNRGWETIVDALKEQALKAGVSIQYNRVIQSVSGNFPEMKAVLKDGTVIHTQNVLSTASPKDTVAMLDTAPESTQTIYNDLIPVRAACLDLVMAGLPRPKTSFALGVERPLYFSNHSAAAALTDEPGHAVVHVMKYVSPMDDSSPEQDLHELELFLDLIQPEWRNYLVHRRFLPRMTVSNAIATAGMNGLKGRPEPFLKEKPGFYVAGDWVGDEGMLGNASLSSAKKAAQYIIDGK